MKKIILLISILTIVSVQGQVTLIPDMDFEQSLISQGIDTDGLINGQVLTADISDETTLNVFKEGIFSLEGIQDFTSLEILDCSANFISELDISNLISLRNLYCFENQLTELNTSNLLQLETLNCVQNAIMSLDVSNNTLLTSLYIGNEQHDVWPKNVISSINLTNNVNLEILGCEDLMSLSSLDLSSNTQLRVLYASYCNLDVLDLSNNIQLQRLYLGNPLTYTIPSNNITSLDLSANSNLFRLYAPYTTISNLNLKNGANSNLTNVELRENNNLFCIEVDDPVAANTGNAPYGAWETEPQVYYQNDCSLGTEDFDPEKSSVLPNPAKNNVAVNAPHSIIDKVIFYSLQGSQVMIANTNFENIDLSTLSTGMYLCAIHTDKSVFFKRILKK